MTDSRLEMQGERWQPPPELARVRPRPVCLTAAGKAAVGAVLVLLLGALGGGISLYLLAERDSARLASLQKEGVSTEAEVIERGRSGGESTRYFIVYRYAANGQFYRERANLRRSNWQKLQVGSTIPVRYWISKPDMSWLPGREPKGVPVWVVPIVSVSLLLATWPILYEIRRQWRLLSEGRPALARVTHSKRVGHSHGGHHHRVYYEFLVLSGAKRSGHYNASKNPPPGETLTVIYDPDEPTRQARHPLSLVRTMLGS